MDESAFDPNWLFDDPKALDTDEFADDATVLLLLPNNGVGCTCDVVPNGDGLGAAVPEPNAAPNGADDVRDECLPLPFAPKYNSGMALDGNVVRKPCIPFLIVLRKRVADGIPMEVSSNRVHISFVMTSRYC